MWNVPHVSTVYLIKGAWLKSHTPDYSNERFEVDMAFTAWMRGKVGRQCNDWFHVCFGVRLSWRCCRVTSCMSPTWRTMDTW